MESSAPIPARVRGCAFHAVKAAPAAFRVLVEPVFRQDMELAATQKWSGKPIGVFPAKRWDDAVKRNVRRNTGETSRGYTAKAK